MTQRLTRGQKLVVASHNEGKVLEINELIGPFGLEAISAGSLNLAEPVEDGDSFAANAIIKAVASAEATALPALSDDSGLEVAGLDGAPGIYSARWAGDTKDFAAAMKRVIDELEARGCVSPAARRANFTCALALVVPGHEPQVYEGKVFGQIVAPPRGTLGFGYDPIFIADGETLTFGEMAPSRKHELSHRARAFELFKAAALPLEG
ncbi:MAG: non-canonical purine NTP pyrophosphatase [Rhodomicrobium sp.]|nr:MAG: non-canonical purine NTP pyrophosphatase [Rhodomicrobium sp.]